MDVAPGIKAGTVWVNCTNRFDAASGFGGYRESGFGREGGREGMWEYLKPAVRERPGGAVVGERAGVWVAGDAMPTREGAPGDGMPARDPAAGRSERQAGPAPRRPGRPHPEALDRRQAAAPRRRLFAHAAGRGRAPVGRSAPRQPQGRAGRGRGRGEGPGAVGRHDRLPARADPVLRGRERSRARRRACRAAEGSGGDDGGGGGRRGGSRGAGALHLCGVGGQARRARALHPLSPTSPSQ